MEWQLGLDIVLWVQGWRTPLLEWLLLPLHWAGATALYLVILPFLYWSLDADLGRRVTLVFLGGAWINGWLKVLLDQPRPAEVSALVQPVVAAHGPGMPSGHAMTATILWGLVAFWMRRPWFTAVAVAFILATGVSRVVHGVHFPGDVLAGWVLGAGVVFAAAHLEAPLRAFVASRGTWARCALVGVITAVLLLICPGVTVCGQRGTYTPTVAAAGAFAGAALGMVIERARLRFAVGGGWAQRAGGYLVGVVTVAVVYGCTTVADQRLALAPGWAEEVVRFGRYAIVGAWLAAGAPWVLIRVGLLPVESPP